MKTLLLDPQITSASTKDVCLISYNEARLGKSLRLASHMRTVWLARYVCSGHTRHSYCDDMKCMPELC